MAAGKLFDFQKPKTPDLSYYLLEFVVMGHDNLYAIVFPFPTALLGELQAMLQLHSHVRSLLATQLPGIPCAMVGMRLIPEEEAQRLVGEQELQAQRAAEGERDVS